MLLLESLTFAFKWGNAVHGAGNLVCSPYGLPSWFLSLHKNVRENQ